MTTDTPSPAPGTCPSQHTCGIDGSPRIGGVPCPVCSPAPAEGLDWALAEQMTGRPVRSILDHAVREELDSQHRLALARVRAQARQEFAAECRTRLVAHDPVGLKTTGLYDWLTKEMGQ